MTSRPNSITSRLGSPFPHTPELDEAYNTARYLTTSNYFGLRFDDDTGELAVKCTVSEDESIERREIVGLPGTIFANLSLLSEIRSQVASEERRINLVF